MSSTKWPKKAQDCKRLFRITAMFDYEHRQVFFGFSQSKFWNKERHHCIMRFNHFANACLEQPE